MQEEQPEWLKPIDLDELLETGEKDERGRGTGSGAEEDSMFMGEGEFLGEEEEEWDGDLTWATAPQVGVHLCGQCCHICRQC